MTVETLNLPPSPPGFRGLHPDLPIKSYHRRLPHWRQMGAIYFVTFRLAGTIPQQVLDDLLAEKERLLLSKKWGGTSDASRCGA